MQRRAPTFLCLMFFLACLTRETAWAEGFLKLDEDAVVTRIAFGSCMDEELEQPLWPAVFEFEPDLFVFAGDNVYGSKQGGWPVDLSDDLTPLRQSYDMLAARPELQQLKSTVPVLATWDDHDYGGRDGGADFSMRLESEAMFRDFWGIDPGRLPPKGAGVYQSHLIGPEGRRVQIILLDTRSFRSPLKKAPLHQRALGKRYVPDPDPAKSMLGEAQWAWLERELRRPADLRLIISSIQVLSDGHQFERWGNLPLELERLLGLVETTSANGVILLSGDMHRGSLHRMARPALYPIYEVTSSPFTKPIPDNDGGTTALASPFGELNFGAVIIDWESSLVTLQLRNQTGKPVQEVAITFDQLTFDNAARR